MKSFLSAILLSSVLTTSLMPKQADAGVILFTTGAGFTMIDAYSSHRIQLARVGTPLMIVGAITGAIGVLTMAAGGASFVILSEDGSLAQSDLEAALTEKYPFIQENKVIADLATLVKSKAENTKENNGKKMISLTEAEVKSVFESTDLLETHVSEVQAMVLDLK